MLYQLVRDSFVPLSTSVIKNSNIFQKKTIRKSIRKLFGYTAPTIDWYILTKSVKLCKKKFLFLQLQTFSTYTTWTSRLTKLRKNKDIVITKPDKGNRVVILDWRLYAIEEVISDTSKFKKLSEDPTLKREASLQRFLRKLKQKTFLMKLNTINCILLVLLLLVYMVLLTCTNSPLVILFLNFVRLFHL